ncbi:hypothetical protein [Mucilaginibacter segetis]|uniref:thymidine phosphorylase n=1 Tax=Mucilaginibacter segetis TaxID=2793071 RepID=A0A934PTJ2_9SPHI|nr:hypothetical protein [Mucilaginibacter segetis]MBK0379322.1 hypothetical protein [Mucilaginibacter segetis]
MTELFEVFRAIDQGKTISEPALNKLFAIPNIKDFQLTAVAAQLYLRGELSTTEEAFTSKILTDKELFNEGLTKKIFLGEFISEKDWQPLIKEICADTVDREKLAVLLSVIKYKGLTEGSISTMTLAMWHSGNTYDYRGMNRLGYKKVIRRYPTGALSEKIALIMPSLLMAFARQIPIISPFTIGRSLAFTGGTWDKLSAIKGFKFPEQGEETVKMLVKCGISMTVTGANYNPADDFLYPFRSLTHTVNSFPLIVSSIASKQLAVPADALLLDVRYGEGAFLVDREEASALASSIAAILKDQNICCQSCFTISNQPTGAAIGNYWEILEAVNLMGGRNYLTGRLNLAGLAEQKALVIQMTAQLIKITFPELDENDLYKMADEFFETGEVLKNFRFLLACHGVKQIESDRLFADAQPSSYMETSIYAEHSGVLNQIHQQKLGSFVNFELGGGQNQFFGIDQERQSGLILTKRLNDPVREGEVLAIIFHHQPIDQRLLESSLYFNIN